MTKLPSVLFGTCAGIACLSWAATGLTQEIARPSVDRSAAGQPRPTLPRDTLSRIDLEVVQRRLQATGAVPPDSPLTSPRVSLGRKLFFDGVLSKDGTVSCASCHQPEHGFASPDAKAIGIGGQTGRRNAPTLWNRAFGTSQFWDGRAATLEEQALQPIANPQEMGHSVEAVVEALRRDPDYQQQFALAFGDDGHVEDAPEPQRQVTAENLAKALASFQRTLLTHDSAVDRFQGGAYDALTDDERQGLWIFESRGRCWKCHSGDHYSDESFHSTGVGYRRSAGDVGRYEVTKTESDRGKFKTPTLRAIALTAPYMHDGSLKSLQEVVEFYNHGGDPDDPQLDPQIVPLGLSDEEVQQLVAFLQALSR